MKAYYEKKYSLRSNDFDKNNRLNISSILDIFQTAASEHAALLGVGYEEMIKKQLFWVLTKIKFEIYKTPERYSEIRVKTWPLAPGRVSFIREYLVFDDKDNIIIKGSSEWVTVHAVMRRIAPAGNIYNLDINEYLPDMNFDGKISKLPAFETGESAYEFSPCYTDIDVNQHMNNTKYANYIMSAISNENVEITAFQIDYHSETLRNEIVSIFTAEENNCIKFQGKNKDGVIKFSAMIEVNTSI